MARQSLRRYLTATQLQEYQPSITTVDNNTLIDAEIEVDLAIASFLENGYSKAFKNDDIYNNCLVNASTVTIPDFSFNDGYLSKTVVEILSGANSGSCFFVDSQTSNVLTLIETSGLTNVTCDIRVYQLAKAPFAKDCVLTNNKYYKVLDERVKQAVAYQYVYLTEENAVNTYAQTGYSVNGANYSENYDTSKKTTIVDRLNPKVLDVLGYLTIQSS